MVWLKFFLSARSGCCLIFTGTTRPDSFLGFWTASILASRDFFHFLQRCLVRFPRFLRWALPAQVDFLLGLGGPPVFGFSAARTKFPMPDPCCYSRSPVQIHFLCCFAARNFGIHAWSWVRCWSGESTDQTLHSDLNIAAVIRVLLSQLGFAHPWIHCSCFHT
jgi:hypothetical protein